VRCTNPWGISSPICSAAGGLERLQNALFNIKVVSETAEAETAVDQSRLSDQENKLFVEVNSAEEKFREAMDDDFNTALALSRLFDFTKQANIVVQMEPSPTRRALLRMAKEKIEKIAGVLGLQLESGKEQRSEGFTDQLVGLLVELREELRRSRQWAVADRIRDELSKLSIELEDRPEGTVWRWKGRKNF